MSHRMWRNIGLEEEQYVRKVSDRKLIARLAKYVLKYRWRFIVAIIAVLLTSVTALLSPYLIMVAIDTYIANKDLAGLTFISMALVGIYLVNWISDYQRTFQVSWMGENMVNEMRKQLFSHLQELSFSFYDRSEAGRIISRVTNDTDTIIQVFVQGLVTVVSDVVTLVGIVAVMLLLSIPLTLATLLVLPLLVFFTWIFHSRLRKAYGTTRKKIAIVTSRLEESVSGIREIKSFTREQDTMRDFRQANIENLQANVEAGRLFALTAPTVQIIGAIGTGLVLWFSGMLTVGGGITVGLVVAFLLYVGRFFAPIINLAMFYNTIQSSLAAAERIFETLDAKVDIFDIKDAIELTNVHGEIVFENVNFSYNPKETALKNVSISVNPGETLAIVGPTGAGKSTLVKLLSRFYEPQSGTIKIDNKDIQKVTLNSLRRNMGIVLQEPFLFSGTIIDNIRYGKLDASEKEVRTVAEIVGAHNFISRFPEGYQTNVGERGTRLSVGQRQLVSFARALLHNPPILILDEATSSIDPYMESKIVKAMSILSKDRTTLVIAHRLSTVRNAHRIVVIDQGKIVEMGNHRELMKKKGLYHRLYRKQFKDI